MNKLKMIFGLFLFGLVGCSLGADFEQYIAPNAPRVNLAPSSMGGPTETRWKLTTAVGSKLVMLCALQDLDCSNVNIIIWNGATVLDVCDVERPVSANNSISNEMSVTIRTRGKAFPGFCQVHATKQYMNFVEKDIDSSEDGQPKGKKPATCSCGWTNKKKAIGRIVGGKAATVNEYPFPILLMKTERRSPFCGGSIITPYHALTAAHCTHPYIGIPLSIVVGEHDITTYTDTPHTKIIDVAQAIDHEQYNPKTNLNDISLLYLTEKIEFNQYVGRVCMPSVQNDLAEQYIKVMGWGLTTHKGRTSPILRKVNLKVVDPDVCKAIFSIDPTKRTQICTYNHEKDSCQGDSGGPLVWLNKDTNMYTQVALVSYGRDCASTEPAVNTDVAAYMDWIKEKIKGTQPNAEMCY